MTTPAYRPDRPLAHLLATRPEVADIGTAAQATELGVWAA